MSKKVDITFKDQRSMLELYFAENTSMRHVMDTARRRMEHYLRKPESYEKIAFKEDHIRKAKKEYDEKRAEIDLYAAPFGLEIFKQFISKKNPHVFMVIGGTFYKGKRTFPTVIPADLGTNPWQLFDRQCLGKYETLDDAITITQKNRFLEEKWDDILNQGYSKLDTERSMYFLIAEKDLDYFRNDSGAVCLEELVPHITEVDGMIGLKKDVEIPSKQSYFEKSPPFVSFRQKKSMRRKTKRYVTYKPGSFQTYMDVLGDMYGAKIKVNDKEFVESVIHRLRGRDEGETNKLGNFLLQNIGCDDYVTRPKENGYDTFHYEGMISINDVQFPVELQIEHNGMHYGGSIDKNDKRHHNKHVRQELTIPKSAHRLQFDFDKSLIEIMGLGYTPEEFY